MNYRSTLFFVEIDFVFAELRNIFIVMKQIRNDSLKDKRDMAVPSPNIEILPSLHFYLFLDLRIIDKI